MYRISLVSPEPRPVKTIIASDVCNIADGSGGGDKAEAKRRVEEAAQQLRNPVLQDRLREAVDARPVRHVVRCPVHVKKMREYLQTPDAGEQRAGGTGGWSGQTNGDARESQRE